jgi:replicative DNA helicase
MDNGRKASIEAERCVLGQMILDPMEIDIAIQINIPEHFSLPAHALLFRTLADMRNAGTPIDLVFLRDELAGMHQLEAVGGVDYMVSLAEGAPNARVEPYAKKVRKAALRRKKEAQ